MAYIKICMLSEKIVTILILIDGFLQLRDSFIQAYGVRCHNPYFNRWFSAIKIGDRMVKTEKMSQSLF